MKCLIEWCNINQGFLSAILSIVTVMITIYVMWRSNKNSRDILEKQLNQDKEIELRQEDMQRRQLKVDSYPYRLECWKVLQTIKYIAGILSIANEETLFNKPDGDLYALYTKMFVDKNSTANEICLSLEQAQNVFSVKSWSDIKQISKLYMEITNEFQMFQICDEIMAKEEKQQFKKNAIRKIIDNSKSILNKIERVILIVNIDLCISDLHEVRGVYDDGLIHNDSFENSFENK